MRLKILHIIFVLTSIAVVILRSLKTCKCINTIQVSLIEKHLVGCSLKISHCCTLVHLFFKKQKLYVQVLKVPELNCFRLLC